jgi:Cu/Ag efflux protein CusF
MRTISSLLLATAFSLTLFAMGDEHSSHGHSTSITTSQQVIEATGIVKSIASNHERLRIFHDPIPSLKWPAMNMEFKVKDHDMTHTLEVGDKVKFSFIRQEADNTIVKISK